MIYKYEELFDRNEGQDRRSKARTRCFIFAFYSDAICVGKTAFFQNVGPRGSSSAE